MDLRISGLGARVAMFASVSLSLQIVAFEPRIASAQTPCPVPPQTSAPNTKDLTKLGYFKGVGLLYDSVVTRNPRAPIPCSDRYYVIYQYTYESLEVVEINPCPSTSSPLYKTFSTSGVRKELRPTGATTIVAGQSGNVYIGTSPGGRIHWIDNNTSSPPSLKDLGRVDGKCDFQSNGTVTSPTDMYIYDITSIAGPGGFHYAVTYPGANLYRFQDGANPSRPTLVRQVDSSQRYARYAVIMNNNLFVGTGKDTPKVFRYPLNPDVDMTTPADAFQLFVGTSNDYEVATLAEGIDGHLYASHPTSTKTGLVYHQLTETIGGNEVPREVAAIKQVLSSDPELKKSNRLTTGQLISVQQSNDTSVQPPKYEVHISEGAGNAAPEKHYDYDYNGSRLGIHGFVVAGDYVYGTSALPCRFFATPSAIQASNSAIAPKGNLLGGGQMYTAATAELSPSAKLLVFGTYSTHSRWYTTPLGTTPSEPKPLDLPLGAPSIKATWRPWTMARYSVTGTNPENKVWVYAGSPHEEKGRNGGFIAAVKLGRKVAGDVTSAVVADEMRLFRTFNTNNNAYLPFLNNNMENHSITGLLVEGTTLYGGTGLQGNDASQPLSGPAKLFQIQLSAQDGFPTDSSSVTAVNVSSTSEPWYPTIPFGGIQNLIWHKNKLWGVLDQARLIVVDQPATLSGISTQSLDPNLENKPKALVRNSNYGGVLNNTMVEYNGSLWLTTRNGILQINTNRTNNTGPYTLTLHPLVVDGTPVQPTGGGGVKDGFLYLSVGADLMAYKLP